MLPLAPGRPAGALSMRYPHESVGDGTAKPVTLVCPASGEVRVKRVRSAADAVLHPWLQAELTAILATLPEPEPDAGSVKERR
jgi:hypothetical protein